MLPTVDELQPGTHNGPAMDRCLHKYGEFTSGVWRYGCSLPRQLRCSRHEHVKRLRIGFVGPEWRRVCFGWEVGPPQEQLLPMPNALVVD